MWIRDDKGALQNSRPCNTNESLLFINLSTLRGRFHRRCGELLWGQRGVSVDKGALQNSRPCNTTQSLLFRRFIWVLLYPL